MHGAPSSCRAGVTRLAPLCRGPCRPQLIPSFPLHPKGHLLPSSVLTGSCPEFAHSSSERDSPSVQGAEQPQGRVTDAVTRTAAAQCRPSTARGNLPAAPRCGLTREAHIWPSQHRDPDRWVLGYPEPAAAGAAAREPGRGSQGGPGSSGVRGGLQEWSPRHGQTQPWAPGAPVALREWHEVASAARRVRVPGEGVRGALSLPQAPWVVGTEEGYRRGSWAGGPSTARHPAALRTSVGVRGVAQPRGSTARAPQGDGPGGQQRGSGAGSRGRGRGRAALLT